MMCTGAYPYALQVFADIAWHGIDNIMIVHNVTICWQDAGGGIEGNAHVAAAGV